jgi:uncharacterized protein (TIGR03084 family)
MTIAEADHFLSESQNLHTLIERGGPHVLARETLFKRWSVERIIGHLHVWNRAALFSLAGEEAFAGFMADIGRAMASGGMAKGEMDFLGELRGEALVSEWINFASQLADTVRTRDPADRVKWVGPDMSVRSSITARLMESWAHGQAIYDALGVERAETDAIRGIAVLGVNTYGWTFKVRRQEPPAPKPFVTLIAPSGEIWSFGEDNAEERIEGSAVEFCRVVTQTRNIADTALRVTGPNATLWMSVAQCFAGPPNPPPLPGERRKQG